MSRAHGDQRGWSGVADAVQVTLEAHARVDSHRDGTELEQSKHADDEVMAGTDCEQDARSLGDALRVEDPCGRIAFLVELLKRALRMDDPPLGAHRQRRKRSRQVRRLGGGGAEVSGDVAARVVHFA